MEKTLTVRISGEHLKKLSEMRKATGLTPSQIVRRLIERVEIRPLELIVSETKDSDHGEV